MGSIRTELEIDHPAGETGTLRGTQRQPIVTTDDPPAEFLSRAVPPEQRADLPALETLTATDPVWGVTLRLPAYFAVTLAALPAWWLWSRLTSSGAAEFPGVSFWPPLLLSLVALLALCVLARQARAPYRWKLDAEGIEARGLFFRRRLRWSELRTVTTVRGVATLWEYRLEGPEGRISFPDRAAAHGTGTPLTSAVWQQLRRYGRHEVLALQPEHESVWDTLPPMAAPPARVLPAPSARSYQRSALVIAGFLPLWILLLVVSMLEPPSHTLGWKFLVPGVLFHCSGLLRSLRAHWENFRRQAFHCRITEHGLEGQTCQGPFAIDWDSICSARWGSREDAEGAMLCLASSSGREVRLPTGPDEPETNSLIFAVLQRLRYAASAQAPPLPAWLRAPGASNARATGNDPATSRVFPE